MVSTVNQNGRVIITNSWLGSAYLLYASDNNQNFKISALDSNYHNVTSVVSQLNGWSC